MTAIGDAYGAAFEFEKETRHVRNNLTYKKHLTFSIGDGQFTDDTQMSVAVFDVISSKKIEDMVEEDFVKSFVESYKAMPIEGYTKYFKEVMETCTVGNFTSKIVPNSTKSGSCMRSASIGLYRNIDEILYVSKLQSIVTHNTDIAIECAQAISLASHYFLYNKGISKYLGEFLNKTIKGNIDWIDTHLDWATSEAIDCSRNAIHLLKTTRNYSSILMDAVTAGGDTDTVASMALGIASLSHYHVDDLPEELYQYKNLKNLDFLVPKEIEFLQFQKRK